MDEPTHPWSTLVGTALGRSTPRVIDQQTVDTHAATTGDAQWIHNDPERARAEGPFGGPIVQGFLLLASLTAHCAELRFPAGSSVSMMVNYGFDRVRFVAPVPVGARMWIEGTIAEVRPRAGGDAVVAIDVDLWSDGPDGRSATRAVMARWLFLAVAA